ncbi:MAG: tetratricopeptide repeat protein [Bacteroidota bacterium]|nr:tetratricopeptide repeat protein [Bacteroidota bacterium]
MNYVRVFSFCFFTLLAVSCKHKEKIAKTQPDLQFRDTHMGDDDKPGTMTAGKATEEETFVQGCIQKALGNPARALVEFQECLQMNPKSAAANYEIAGIYNQKGQPDRALKYAKAANELSPGNRWYKLRYAQVLLANNQADQAIKIFKDLADSEPENVDILLRYADALKTAARPDEALLIYNRIESIEGISDTLQNSRIVIYKAKNDLIGEENALKALEHAFPENITYSDRLGDFYIRTNQPQKAMEVFAGMSTRYPLTVTPHLKLASYYAAQGQNEKAFSETAVAFEIPDANTFDDKIASLNSLYPSDDAAPVLSASKRKEADSLLRILRRVHPDKAAPYSITGNIYYKEGKFKEAREMYHKAADLGQNEYAPWKRLLEINAKLNDNAAMEKDAKQAMELFPTQPDAYFYLGMIQYNKKEYNKAIDNLESGRDFLTDNPKKDLEIRTILVDAYRATGKTNKADNYSEAVIEKDSSNIPLIVAYCESMCTQRTKLYNAEQLMLYVITKEPSNPSYYELLGWIEYQMDDYKTAAQWMSKALSLTPNNPRMNERLGDIEYKNGNKEVALGYWKKAKEKGGTGAALDNKIATKSMDEN